MFENPEGVGENLGFQGRQRNKKQTEQKSSFLGFLWYFSIQDSKLEREKTYLCRVMQESGIKTETGQINGGEKMNYRVHYYGCIVFICTYGSAQVMVNLRPMSFCQGEMLILTSELHLTIQKTTGDFSARYICFPESVFKTVYYKIPNMALWDYLFMHPVLPLAGERQQAASEWANQTVWQQKHLKENVLEEVAANSAYALFCAIDAAISERYPKTPQANKNRSWSIMTGFFSLLYRHYTGHRNVAFYASKLNISADYLTKVSRHLYGLSPKELIDEQVIEEMKHLLCDTDSTVKEIADMLHYEDTSYLCRFFRRKTGMSPMQFRNSRL